MKFWLTETSHFRLHPHCSSFAPRPFLLSYDEMFDSSRRALNSKNRESSCANGPTRFSLLFDERLESFPLIQYLAGTWEKSRRPRTRFAIVSLIAGICSHANFWLSVFETSVAVYLLIYIRCWLSSVFLWTFSAESPGFLMVFWRDFWKCKYLALACLFTYQQPISIPAIKINLNDDKWVLKQLLRVEMVSGETMAKIQLPQYKSA